MAKTHRPATPISPLVHEILKKPATVDCETVLQNQTPAEETLFEGYPLPARGATLKVGEARSGKTLLAIHEALAIARGQPLFDNYRLAKPPGAVLIVEQDDPGGVASIRTILERAGVTKPYPPFYVTPSLPFGFGDAMLDWLGEEIAKYTLRLVVLDSYTAIRSARPPGADIVKFEQMELQRLDELAKRTGCAIQIIHHGSKGAAGLDWTQAAAGSFAMAMATESQIHLSRFAELESGAPQRLVRIRGRHSDDTQLVLKFRKETLDFEFVMDGPRAEHYVVLQQIDAELGAAEFGPKELGQVTGLSRSAVTRLLARLRNTGGLTKKAYGKYQLDRNWSA
jgi:hypothetical protein